MQDNELYQQILGLASPWKVSRVELNAEQQEICVRVSHPRGAKFCCPDCGLALACHDHADERRWRHLDSCQYRTVLIASQPRVKCPEHGVKTAAVPWAEKSSRFTLLFERLAIDVLLATQTVKGAQGILRTSWDETWQIVKKAVARGQDRKSDKPLPRIGIDEKAFRKGQDYITLIYDLDNSTVEAISDGNDTQSGRACFSQLSKGQIASVEAVAMDMSAAYVKAAKESVPLAEAKMANRGHPSFQVYCNASLGTSARGTSAARVDAQSGDVAGVEIVDLDGSGAPCRPLPPDPPGAGWPEPRVMFHACGGKEHTRRAAGRSPAAIGFGPSGAR